jgi:hypothetical protein
VKKTPVLYVPLVALLCAAMTGCSAASPDSSPAPVPAPGLVTRDASSDEVALAALATGTLVLDNGCIQLDNGVVPVFPEEDARWDGTTLTWKGDAYLIGDTITLGGGEYTEELSDKIVPPECGAGRGWAVSPGRFDR